MPAHPALGARTGRRRGLAPHPPPARRSKPAAASTAPSPRLAAGAMLVPPGVVSLIDWAVLALTGFIAAASLVGALYSVPWTRRARRMAPTRAFNYLWVTRFTLQITGALYALALDLRLQVRRGGARAR